MSDAVSVEPLPYSAEDLERRIGVDWSERLLAAYRWMILGRTLDARMLALQRQGRIGFYGPATGQEAVAVGAWMATRPEDWIFPGLREQLLALARGHSLTTYLHHLFANDEDPARGRQMPCHPTAREVHYVSMSSVIGTQITQAVGTAYAMRQRKDPSVAFAFFGDGATSANDFHAGMNLAAVFQLPVVFCCTNNQWAISVPVERQSAVAHLSSKATAYGMPGSTVDGTDVVAVYEAMSPAGEKARGGGGPTMLEFVLYRMTPHSSSDDPTRYQAKDWMERARAHDPVHRLEGLLETLGVLLPEAKATIAQDADAQVREAIAVAEKVAPPAPGSLNMDVLAPPPAPSEGPPG
jgi:pyruvate dehydrogenase E1 component alpha subunit/2-oxoisovalerate dehydrogenase E1 component alpha subunit